MCSHRLVNRYGLVFKSSGLDCKVTKLAHWNFELSTSSDTNVGRKTNYGRHFTRVISISQIILLKVQKIQTKFSCLFAAFVFVRLYGYLVPSL